jgi:4-hydroxy-3-methylbut-2-en-1-yl diphosphate synthase IspG/GcpE
MMLCPFCGSDQLRISRFRARDFKYLFRMRYPVRACVLGCIAC